jgi:hypothetical protein
MPGGPQSLAILPTKLRLATTLRMGALQVESPKCGVCVNFHYEEAFIEAEGSLYQLIQVGLEEMDGRVASHSSRVPPTSSVGYPL